MNDRDYLSIGEVLSVLLNEFPDVTISKIRFLEGQGLIEPERTPSGYRKFSPNEVERLRYILREQREKYLPLRVIRSQLDDSATEGTDIDRGRNDVTEGIERSERAHPTSRLAPVRHEPDRAPELAEKADERRQGRALRAEAIAHTDITESLPRDLVISQVGLPADFLRELEGTGLVHGHQVGDTTFFDPASVELARVALKFRDLGIDVRHLRAWKIAADKESSLFEQRILPIMRQRNPGARDEALELLGELVELGAHLRAALMKREIDRLSEGR